eukprot:6117-Heterococcus_DN1.PRE.2
MTQSCTNDSNLLRSLLPRGVSHASPRGISVLVTGLLSATSWLTLVHAIVLADRTMQYASGISCRKQHLTHPVKSCVQMA